MSHHWSKAELLKRYNYLREETNHLTEVATLRVYAALTASGLDISQAHAAVDAMQKAGILFREKEKK